jgi:hypothetical protein
MKKVILSPAEILKGFKVNTEMGMKAAAPSYAELMKKIAVLEVEAAKALAIETFLDCDYEKVKVSKRVPKSPRFSLGYVH